MVTSHQMLRQEITYLPHRRVCGALTSAVSTLIGTIHTVLDPVAETRHGNTQLGPQTIVFIWLTSLGFTLGT